MSKIDASAVPDANLLHISRATPPLASDSADLISERIARGQAEDRSLGAGLLILPALAAVMMSLWTKPELTPLFATLPVAAFVVSVRAAFHPSSATDEWHGR